MFHLFNTHLASSSDTLGTVTHSGETVLNEEGFVDGVVIRSRAQTVGPGLGPAVRLFLHCANIIQPCMV